jgi:tripartite-type tricarboxylate transporter receptor subunit TctC
MMAENLCKLPKYTVAVFLLLASFFSISAANAQPYPNKPVTLIAGFPPGGSADLLARLIAQKLSGTFGQTFIVENRVGAGGTIGASAVAKASPDGYTLFLGSTATQSIAPSIYKNLPYQSPQNFQPITMVAQIPVALVVNPDVKATTAPELVILAKNAREPLTYASSGVGAIPHLAGELFQKSTGIKLTHIPYKGAPLALTDLLSGRVDMMFDHLPTVLPNIRSGKLRALAIAGNKRARALPNVATLAEVGITNAEVISWFGVLAPQGIAPAITKRLNEEIIKILASDEVKNHLFEMGADPFPLATEEFSKFLDADIKKWAKLVKDTGAQAD